MSEIQKESTAVKPQWFLLIICILISCICGLGFLTLINYINVEKYFVYYGSTGPYTVTIDPGFDPDQSHLHMGETSKIFYPGDWVGYTSAISIETGVTTVSSIALVNSDDSIIAVDEFITNDVLSRRTGAPKSLFFHLPVNLTPGIYKLKRRAIFIPQIGIPASQVFPSIEFEVKNK